ncbi:MAG TPA: hypothetical protein DEQ28_01980 [Clostridiales bacterium]|nr:hypothetical protein [Clostridiales bacterium]
MVSLIREERGAVLLTFALFLMGLLLITSLVADLGRVHLARAQAQGMLDAAALAGVAEASYISEVVATEWVRETYWVYVLIGHDEHGLPVWEWQEREWWWERCAVARVHAVVDAGRAWEVARDVFDANAALLGGAGVQAALVGARILGSDPYPRWIRQGEVGEDVTGRPGASFTSQDELELQAQVTVRFVLAGRLLAALGDPGRGVLTMHQRSRARAHVR